ncbi:MAG: ExbD/TolR family protein [Prosthecobacter sp.]
MKRRSPPRQLRLITEISITPFMDVVLVLLFVFVLAAPLLMADKPWLPEAKPAVAAAAPAPAERLTLTVNRDLSVTLNGAMLARADLPASLKQLAARKPGVGIEVRIHRDLPVQNLLDTMGMLETAGIQKTAVTTHAEEP